MTNAQTSTVKRPQVKARVRKDLHGCAYGAFPSTIVLDIELPFAPAELENTDWAKVDSAIAAYLTADAGNAMGTPSETFHENLAERIAALTVSCMQMAGLAVFSSGKLLNWRSSESDAELGLALPALPGGGRVTFDASVWAILLVWSLIRGANDDAIRRLSEDRRKLIEKFEQNRLGGTNTLRFLEAAHQLGIPVPLIFNHHCQFGWGKKQLLAQSSVLDTTGNLGVAIARDKHVTAKILNRAGLPGPIHRIVGSWDEARATATELGYPVVVKPANLDGGVGVFAGLRNEQQLAEAWPQTVKQKKKILVEKHCDGEDFRLIVVDGTLRWAVSRQPAGVTGDGEHSAPQLVEISNRDPRRGYHATASLRPLVLDEEAWGLLKETGIGANDVIERGRFVRLRRSSNLSSGGMPIVVTDMVHPDNRALVERAVELIGLDVAGVDLIIPDIGKSWRETGATIIEINAQPQLIAASQEHLYADILRARIDGEGRIPAVLVVASSESGFAERLLEESSGPLYSGVGVAACGQAYVGGKPIGIKGLSPLRAGNALLMHRDVEALIVVGEEHALLKTGLPFDRFDVLAIVDPLAGRDAVTHAQFLEVMDLVADHCRDQVLVCGSTSHAALMEHGKLEDREILQLPEMDDLIRRVLACAVPVMDGAAPGGEGQ